VAHTGEFMVTYNYVIEKLAMSNDVNHMWKRMVKANDRKKIGKAIHKYITAHWYLVPSAKNGKLTYYYKPKCITKLTRAQLIALYQFFFTPKEIVKIYHWE